MLATDLNKLGEYLHRFSRKRRSRTEIEMEDFYS